MTTQLTQIEYNNIQQLIGLAYKDKPIQEIKQLNKQQTFSNYFDIAIYWIKLIHPEYIHLIPSNIEPEILCYKQVSIKNKTNEQEVEDVSDGIVDDTTVTKQRNTKYKNQKDKLSNTRSESEDLSEPLQING